MLGTGENISDEVWNQLIKEVDVNGDGEVGSGHAQIEFNEFRDMLIKLL